jgi:hypothetical protein
VHVDDLHRYLEAKNRQVSAKAVARRAALDARAHWLTRHSPTQITSTAPSTKPSRPSTPNA